MTTHPQHLVRRTLAVAAALAAASAIAPAASSAYGWPVKPFDRQHPVRGFFGDPRIDDANHSGSLHFGVDVVAANGTPVYATRSGVVSIHPLHATTIVVSAGGHAHEYWHVIPAVRPGTQAVAYRTVLGHVEAPWAHVHFSERSDGRYVNPLRPGAMAPYVDRTRPEARMVTAERAGSPVPVARLSGRVDLVSEVRDWMPLAAPAPWTGKPVMPALVRWRLVGTGSGTAWTTAFDARLVLPPAGFGGVYARWTRQNKPWRAGRYRVYLARGFDTTRLNGGGSAVEVEVVDTAGNRSSSRTPVGVGAGEEPGRRGLTADRNEDDEEEEGNASAGSSSGRTTRGPSSVRSPGAARATAPSRRSCSPPERGVTVGNETMQLRSPQLARLLGNLRNRLADPR